MLQHFFKCQSSPNSPTYQAIMGLPHKAPSPKMEHINDLRSQSSWNSLFPDKQNTGEANVDFSTNKNMPILYWGTKTGSTSWASEGRLFGPSWTALYWTNIHRWLIDWPACGLWGCDGCYNNLWQSHKRSLYFHSWALCCKSHCAENLELSLRFQGIHNLLQLKVRWWHWGWTSPAHQ